MKWIYFNIMKLPTSFDHWHASANPLTTHHRFWTADGPATQPATVISNALPEIFCLSSSIWHQQIQHLNSKNLMHLLCKHILLS